MSSTPLRTLLPRLASFDYENNIHSQRTPYRPALERGSAIRETSFDMDNNNNNNNTMNYNEHTDNNNTMNYNEHTDNNYNSRSEDNNLAASLNPNPTNTDNSVNQNNSDRRNKFVARKVKYNTIDENGVKVENEVNLETPEDLHKIPSKYLTAKERVYLKEARWTPSRVLMSHLENKLNNTIGRYWWKKYVSAAFWSNIATPINLAITLFTTLTTGQAATESLLSQDVFVRISISSLILSTLNTFFRPHQQMNVNTDAMNKWRHLGTKFEEIYYSECFNDLDYERRIEGYQELQKDVHNEQITQESVIQNYLTDLIYLCVSRSCLARSEWITDKHKTVSNNTTTLKQPANSTSIQLQSPVQSQSQSHNNTDTSQVVIQMDNLEEHVLEQVPPQSTILQDYNADILKLLMETNKREFLELNAKYNSMLEYLNKNNTIIDILFNNTQDANNANNTQDANNANNTQDAIDAAT
jgi:hypothetical protein